MNTFKVTMENGKKKVVIIREASGESRVKEAMMLVMSNQLEEKIQANN